MFPCPNPQICGVQNHRDGTPCRAMSSAAQKGSGKAPVSIPEMTSADDASRLYAKHELLEVKKNSIETSSFQGGNVDVILTMNPYSDSEEPAPMLFETGLIKDSGMGDARVNADRMDEFPYAIKQTGDGDLYVDGAYMSGPNRPVKLESIKGTETTWSYRDESEATDAAPMVRGISQMNKSPEAIAFLKEHAPVENVLNGKFYTLDEAEDQD